MARAPRQNRPEAEDFSGYLVKAPTDLHVRFIDWLKGESVGYDPAAAKNKAEAFAEGVRLGAALRMKFQASPENQELLDERRQVKEAGEEAAPKPKRKTRKAAQEPQPEPEEDEDLEDEDGVEPEEDDDLEDEDVEEDESPQPVRRTRAKAAAPKTAVASRTRRTRAKGKSEAAPF